MLRPYEMVRLTMLISLIHAAFTSIGQASGGGDKQTSITRIPYEAHRLPVTGGGKDSATRRSVSILPH